MTEAEFQAAKATFPWKHTLERTGFGGHFKVIDKTGAEVPFMTLFGVMERVTERIAQSVANNKGD